MASFGEGDAAKDLIWLIGVIGLLVLVWIFTGGPARFERSQSNEEFITSPNVNLLATTSPEGESVNTLNRQKLAKKRTETSLSPNFGQAPLSPNDSPYKGMVKIRLRQSAEKTNNINKEYVSLQANSSNKAAIDISGWKINNGNNNIYYNKSGQIVQGIASTVTIPLGTKLFLGSASSPLQSISLEPGGTAYVITGTGPYVGSYNVNVSFLVNKCSGYLGNYNNYRLFTPALSLKCPSYSQDLQTSFLTEECYNQVKSYGSNCRTPQIVQNPSLGETLDGKVMTTSCKNLILSTFNYSSCVTRHKNDEDFYDRSWYVYLRLSTLGLWPASRATITLYDNLGKLVDSYSY